MKIIDIRATTVTVPLEAPLRHANGCHWGRFVRTIVEVILILQLPFLYGVFAHSSETGPVRALAGAAEGLRLRESTVAMVQLSAHVLSTPWSSLAFPALLVACALTVAVRARHDLN